MPSVQQQTTTTSTTTKQWWSGLVNLQTLLVVFGGFASLVLFWNTVKNHGGNIETLKKEMILKAEKTEVEGLINKLSAEIESINDKQNRQYEQIRTVLERIVVVEKQLEYQRGKSDGLKEVKK